MVWYKQVSFGLLGLSAMASLAGLALPAHAQVTEHGFRKYLARQYFMLAQGEDQDWDIRDSVYLRDMGVATLNYHAIQPHPLEDVPVVSSRPGELQAARDLLVNVQQNGAAAKMPVPFAKALSGFDCWVEQQQSEPNASHNTQACKAIYMANAAQLASLRTQTTQTAEAGPRTENLRVLHSVYFDWDRSNLTPSAREKIDAARTMLTDARYAKLIISGYADASGAKQYNQRLSEKRARNVASYLGLTDDRFEVRVYGYGENYLHVQTADGVRLAENRVVDISVDADKYVEPNQE